MSIDHVGTDVYRSVTTGQTSWTVNAGTAGDLRIIGSVVHSATISVSSVSGGGVTTWARAGSVFNAASGRQLEIWYGTITGSGTAVTFTYSAAIGSTTVRNNVQDFRHSGGSTSFVIQDSGNQTNASSTTYTMPTLTSVNAGELYFGHGHVGNTASAGSTSGFVYTIDANGNPRCYHQNLAAATAYAPTGPHTAASASYFVGAIFAAVDPDADAPAGAASAAASASGAQAASALGGGTTSVSGVALAPVPKVSAMAVRYTRLPENLAVFTSSIPSISASIEAKKVNIVYAVDIGNGSATSFVVTHNLGSRDVLTAVYEAGSPYEEVQPTSIERTSTNTVTVTFPAAPTTNQYRVVVVYG